MFGIFIAIDLVELQPFKVKTFVYLLLMADRLCSARGRSRAENLVRDSAAEERGCLRLV
jgi:hypothetical protein